MRESVKNFESDTLMRSSRLVLQRKCACSAASGMSDECAECKKNGLRRKRKSADKSGLSAVPPMVHEVLRSPGQPLGDKTVSFMEPRFGHEFASVRIHTGAKAADSARLVNALAYTVGGDVVFGAGQYVPDTPVGKRLLAHELAHVAKPCPVVRGAPQISEPSDKCEKEADALAARVMEAPEPASFASNQRDRQYTKQHATYIPGGMVLRQKDSSDARHALAAGDTTARDTTSGPKVIRDTEGRGCPSNLLCAPPYKQYQVCCRVAALHLVGQMDDPQRTMTQWLCIIDAGGAYSQHDTFDEALHSCNELRIKK